MDSTARSQEKVGANAAPKEAGVTLSAERVRQICREEGADEAGFVEVGREAIASERDGILRVYPLTRTVVSLVKQANREGIRSPSLPVADEEFKRTYDDLAAVSRRIVKRLNALGVRGVAIPQGFPMDFTRWPGKIWDVSHKLIAVQAGVGLMGLHRMVIHPRLGDHILLGTLLVDAPVDRYDRPLQENPCIRCGLCASVCPVGAISRDDDFNFLACAMHNYHELLGGFQEWVETLVSVGDVKAYRARFRDGETLEKWQALTLGHAYRCSYCMSVCPAGQEVVGSYEPQKKRYVEAVVRPLKDKAEPVYVIAGTTAEKTARRNPRKELRYVRNTIRPVSIPSFLEGARLAFNAEAARGLHLTLHFTFTGKEEALATISISEGRLTVREGLVGSADLRVTADSAAWVGMLNGEVSFLGALLTRKLKLRGNPMRMREFQRCIL